MPEENEGEGGGPSFTPPASQDELDRIVGQRLARERSKYADYDDLKAKAAKFDEADQASKSEMQKLQDAIAERMAAVATFVASKTSGMTPPTEMPDIPFVSRTPNELPQPFSFRDAGIDVLGAVALVTVMPPAL